MSEVTTACSALPRSVQAHDRHAPRPGPERSLIRMMAGVMSWSWVQWRRRAIIRTLNRVDDHLLRDAGIERSAIEDFVDTLIARRR